MTASFSQAARGKPSLGDLLLSGLGPTHAEIPADAVPSAPKSEVLDLPQVQHLG